MHCIIAAASLDLAYNTHTCVQEPSQADSALLYVFFSCKVVDFTKKLTLVIIGVRVL